jgi:chromosome segregation ATPase
LVRPSAWLAETTPRSNIKLKVRELALHESWFSLETRKTATITPLYREEDLMYLANKDLDQKQARELQNENTQDSSYDEAFKDLEVLQRAKKSLEFARNPADVQTEYQIYDKTVSELQKQYSTLAQSFRELEASYKIVCEHGTNLEKALATCQRQLDQAEKSWLVAMLMRFGFMK